MKRLTARIAADRQFHDDALALDPDEYARIIRAYDDLMWSAKGAFMSVEEAFVRQCPAPLLILPGTDEFQPTEIAERIRAEAPHGTCLPPDWGTPAKVPETRARILAFLREHSRARAQYGSSKLAGTAVAASNQAMTARPTRNSSP